MDEPMTTSTTDARADVERLLGELTVAEKVRLLEGSQSWRTCGVERLGT